MTDLARAIVAAGWNVAAKGEAINLAGAQVAAYRDVVDLVRYLDNQPSASMLWPDETRTWRRYLQVYDISKAARVLEFTPYVTLHEGFAELVAYCKGKRQRALTGNVS
jgi:nucleoside-diphosphate-sugar epimerase